MKYVVTGTHMDHSEAYLWCFDNLEKRSWHVRFCDQGLEITFKNDADATWFALIFS